jgi:crotonobetainyl-CoA:carnitine CoA-transferase CaiB-like acyl-CoA transferase
VFAGALDDVKVLDFTHHIAGPFCTRLLADFGADVIKVERPIVGDIARRIGPFHPGATQPDASGLFMHLNLGKRSVTLDLKSPPAPAVLEELVKWADIVVESFAPRVMPALGLSYERIKEWNPRALMVSISNFGQDGPYRDFKSDDIIAYAMGGPMLMTGSLEGPPSRMGLNVTLYNCGAVAALATATALWAVEEAGSGDYVDLSLMETQMGSQDRRAPALVAHEYTGDTFTRGTFGGGLAFGIYPCQDGYIHIAATTASGYLRLFSLIECEHLLDRLASPLFRSDLQLREEVESEYLLPWLLRRSMEEAWADLQECGIPSGPVFTMEEVMNSDNFRQREYFRKVEYPAVGPVIQTGVPFRMSASPGLLDPIRGNVGIRPAPKLGQHNHEVFEDLLGHNKEEVNDWHLRSYV